MVRFLIENVDSHALDIRWTSSVALSGLSSFVQLNQGLHAPLRSALAPGNLIPRLRRSSIDVLVMNGMEGFLRDSSAGSANATSGVPGACAPGFMLSRAPRACSACERLVNQIYICR